MKPPERVAQVELIARQLVLGAVPPHVKPTVAVQGDAGTWQLIVYDGDAARRLYRTTGRALLELLEQLATEIRDRRREGRMLA